MNDLDWELLDRYLAGVATADERERFERWLAAEPDRAAALDALRNALMGAERDVTPEELEGVWRGVAERIGLGVPEPAVTSPAKAARVGRFAVGKERSRAWRFGAGLAAAAVLVAGGVYAVRQLLIGGVGSAAVEQRVVSVPRGQRAQLRLPDGTGVVLGAGSTLRHPKAFAAETRDVSLEGEAYFTVRHEQRRPFRVRAGDLIATDLGTEFIVQVYPEQSGARVVVRSGTVAVKPAKAAHSTDPGEVVRPGQMARISAVGEPTIEQADTASFFAWTTGTLVFDATPLSEALPQLSRWYDLDFRLADSSLGVIPLSGRLDQTLTPSRLDLLASSIGLEQVQRGQEVTFYRRGSAPR